MAYSSKFVSIYLQRDARQESREVKSYFIKGVAGWCGGSYFAWNIHNTPSLPYAKQFVEVRPP